MVGKDLYATATGLCEGGTACYGSAKYYGQAVLAMLAFAIAYVSRKSQPIAFRKIRKNKGFDLEGLKHLPNGRHPASHIAR
eukprot:19639-Heterococcus_DN1.PRE.4